MNRQSLTKQARWLVPLALIIALAAPASTILPAALRNTSEAAPLQQASNLTWTQVHSAPGVFWYTVDFPTPLVGYALGGPDWNTTSGGTGAVTVAKTTDGGHTWTNIPVPGTNRFMRGLTCIDANRCWIIGASSPRILYTTNGGASWAPGTIVNNAWSGWLWSAGYSGVDTTIFAGTTGYANEPGRMANVLRSTDGVNFNAVVANDPREFVIYDFSCPSPGVCYAAAKNTAFYTANNGATWLRRVVPTGRYYGVSCSDNLSCWQVGAADGSSNTGAYYIFRTQDGGLVWQQASAIPAGSGRPRFWGIDMVDGQNGYAVGCNNVPDPILETCSGQGLLMRTTDGVTWQQVASPSTADLMDVYALSMDEVIVIDWSGKIWRGAGAPTPTPTATNTPTATATPTSTPTRTPTPTATPTNTPTPTATPSTATILGMAFADANGNFFPDAGEPGLAGAVIGLQDGASTVMSATSDPNGAFSFSGVAPGTYSVRGLEAPAGHSLSAGAAIIQVQANTSWMLYTPFVVGIPTPPRYCAYLPQVEASFSGQ